MRGTGEPIAGLVDHARRDSDARDDALLREVARVHAVLEQLARGGAAAGPATQFPPLVRLGDRFGLAAFELDVVAAALAISLDASCARLVGGAPGVPVALATALGRGHGLTASASLAAVVTGSHLLERGLVGLVGEGPLLTRCVVAAADLGPRLVRAEPDAWTRPVGAVALDQLALRPDVRARAEAIVAASGRGRPSALGFVVRGPAGSGRDAVAEALAHAMGFPACVVAATELGAGEVARWSAEVTWRGAALVMKGRPADAVALALARQLPAPLGFVLDPSEPAPTLPARDLYHLDLGELAAVQRAEVWRTALAGLPLASDLDAAQLGELLHVGPAAIASIRDQARIEAQLTGQPITVDTLVAASRRLTPIQAGPHAHLVTPTDELADLIVPPAVARELALIEAWVRHAPAQFRPGASGQHARPATSLTCLFAGPPGTGKSMAAGIVARRLGRALVRVDLAQVVDKYIGETEKHLDGVFAAAAGAGAALLFDEADALFGKRSEVNDARDRYANIEVAFLLQRLEAHRGLVILTTNMRHNLDDAFLRRIHAVVEFPVPDGPERLAIWRRHMSAAHLADDVELEFFAKSFAMAGGDIRNAAATAVVLAAAAGVAVGGRHVAISVWRELRKAGRLVSPDDFGRFAGDVATYLGAS
ncbi:MAG: ATP-binding protein [Kofleriaceae bacterium]